MRILRSLASLRGCEEILSGVGRGAEAKDLRSHRQDLAQLHRPYDWSRSAAGGSSGARWATWIRCNQRSFAPALGPTLAQDFFTASQDDGSSWISRIRRSFGDAAAVSATTASVIAPPKITEGTTP